jgi:hypothetical protein
MQGYKKIIIKLQTNNSSYKTIDIKTFFCYIIKVNLIRSSEDLVP